ncbi:L-rhamnose isomerase [Ktedonobacter racemifer]|uniref:L-rhamnose isomerase n=1 Tax=Ktedonobacter racemifer DSM 44963 TaxID=485913 RepID=D6TSC9_KTERA|nr:L-rhamnose isomerase [Ktedonobacter racemifer]EFH83330.1 L-rhamnose isomerase [Ktedonobacter racemifer DSM 44963]
MAEHFEQIRATLAQQGTDIEQVIAHIQTFSIETPSWGYGNSGTRFKVFPWPGAARDLREKLADAAQVQRVTGCCPTVALHIPWDQVDDWQEIKAYAEHLGLRLGAVNPNLFQDHAYRFGSLCHFDKGVRSQAIAHVLSCIEIAQSIDSNVISLWLADGTNYPGQDDLRHRRHRLLDSLQTIYAALPDRMRLLIEYKFFEPAFYSTDLPDWGTSLLMAQKLGPNAEVLVDTGHHPQGTNIPQIVAQLLDEDRLGGFHFNDRKYADDDLIAGSLNPFELFCIFHEIVGAQHESNANAGRIAYMIDQSHNIEPKIEAMIQSILHIQTAYAKALLVDRVALQQAQESGDVLGAYRVLQAAYETDVRPLLTEVRVRQGLDPDPIAAFRSSGYAEQVARERTLGESVGGYPGA